MVVWTRITACLALLVWLAACGSDAGSGRFDATESPGSSPWDADVTCQSDADCMDGEACEEGVCQMRRCTESYSSEAPLGSFRYLGVDGEIVVVGDNHYVDAFESGGDYLGTVDQSGLGNIRDVAGGNFDGARPQGVATAIAGSHKVRFDQSAGPATLDVGFEPYDLGAGDVDRDGLDELVALGLDGSIAVCDVELSRCSSAKLDGLQGRDVTVGDVDGDGFAEAVFLYNDGDDEGVLVWNLDASLTGQDESRAWSLGFDAKEIDAGDPYGFGYDVLVIKHESGWYDQVSDKLEIFDVEKEEIIATKSVDGHTIDVAVGDRDGDDKDEIVTLRSNHQFEVYGANGGDLSLSKLKSPSIGVGSSAQRIAMMDWNGDSPAGRLVEGPELVAGNAVPITVMVFPPYPAKVSNGPLSASVMVGNNDSTEESLTDTVSLHLGMTLTVGLDAGPFKAKVSGSISKDYAVSKTSSARMSIGARHNVIADPELHGREYAAIIMSCGCYHRYRYESDDPAGKLSGSGKIAELMVPVGGQTQLWSSKRYNQLAKELGTLPIIEVPTRVGDPTSYPSKPQTLAGEPIAEEDMLFPQLPTFQASDVGFVGFFLTVGESETNSVAETTTVGMSAGFGVFGSGVDVDTNIGVTQGYSIRVGKEAIFAGNIPPIPDNPDTPEDEYLEHRFSFSPFVYREHYTDAGGEESGYYVMYYSQSQE